MNQNCAQAEIRVDRIGSQYFTVAGCSSARRIAYQCRAARAGSRRPGIVFRGGIKSQMDGIKASHLDRYAAKTGRAFLRFDYSGHGHSDGVFEAGTIGMWLEECLATIRALTTGPQILVGASMGGWLALLAAQALYESGESGRLKGLILLAPAVDFTEVLLYQKMPASARAELMEDGIWFRSSAHSPVRNPVTRLLIEEGRNHLLFGGDIHVHAPVHILQGMRDESVPWSHALALAEKLVSDPVSLTLVKYGDHRLARDEDLVMLSAVIDAMG